MTLRPRDLERLAERRRAFAAVRRLVPALESGDVAEATDALTRYRKHAGFVHDLHYFLLTTETGVATLWAALTAQCEWFSVHVWKPILAAVVERVGIDPVRAVNDTLEHIRVADCAEGLFEELSFICAVALVRRGALNDAVEIAQRHLERVPRLRHAVECMVGSQQERAVAFARLEQVAPEAETLLRSCKASLRPRRERRDLLVSALRESQLSPLYSSALYGYLPEASGPNTLFLGRGVRDESVAWAFVVARSTEDATAWIEAVAGHPHTTVAPIYSVGANGPSLSLPWTHPMNEGLLLHHDAHWTVRDFTGVSNLLNVAGLHERRGTRWWSDPPSPVPLPPLYERAFETGLFTL